MQKHIKRLHKRSLDKGDSQEIATIVRAERDLVATLDELYDKFNVVTTITIRYNLAKAIQETFFDFTNNKSLYIQWLIHQGLIRWKEKNGK